MTETKRAVKWWWGWEPEVLENWLEQKEAEGWQLVYKSAGWYIWRMEYVSEKPEIYTDVESLMGRNKRLMTILGAIALIEVGPMMSVILDISNNRSVLSFFILIYSFIAYGMYKLSTVNSKLKERKKL